MPHPRWLLASAVVLLSGASAARAQDYVGPSRCFGCHKIGKTAWQSSHAQTLAQLSEPKAAEYAKAVGGDPRNPRCMACHAPVPLAAGPGPVSCETCHGPAKGWLAPHQELPFYSQPVAQWKGMRSLFKNARDVAKLCVDCHVLNDKAIAAAGHPVGASFDAGRDLASPKMVHWPSATVDDTRVRGYDKAFYAAVARESAPLVASRSAGVGGGKAAPRPAPTPAKSGAAPAQTSSEDADLGDDEFVETRGGAASPAPSTGAPVRPTLRPPRVVKVKPLERMPLPDAPSAGFEEPPVALPTPPPPPPPPRLPLEWYAPGREARLKSAARPPCWWRS